MLAIFVEVLLIIASVSSTRSVSVAPAGLVVVVMVVVVVVVVVVAAVVTSESVHATGVETAVYMLHRVESLSVQAESADNATKQLDCCSDQFIQPQSSVQAA